VILQDKSRCKTRISCTTPQHDPPIARVHTSGTCSLGRRPHRFVTPSSKGHKTTCMPQPTSHSHLQACMYPEDIRDKLRATTTPVLLTRSALIAVTAVSTSIIMFHLSHSGLNPQPSTLHPQPSTWAPPVSPHESEYCPGAQVRQGLQTPLLRAAVGDVLQESGSLTACASVSLRILQLSQGRVQLSLSLSYTWTSFPFTLTISHVTQPFGEHWRSSVTLQMRISVCVAALH
jgi:hypothetical protein